MPWMNCIAAPFNAAPAAAAPCTAKQHRLLLAMAACLAWLGLLPHAPAQAQLGGTVPPASHELAIELPYSGEYRRAERGFACGDTVEYQMFHAELPPANMGAEVQLFEAYVDPTGRVRLVARNEAVHVEGVELLVSQ